MYTNTTGTPAEAAPTAAQLAVIKGYVQPLQASGQALAGLNAAQIAAALNAPGAPVPNPQPRGTIQLTALAKPVVLAELASLTSAAYLAGNVNAGSAFNAIAGIVASNTVDPIPLATVQQYAAQAKAAGFDIDAQIAAAASVPDPAWQPAATPGSWALTALNAWVEASDVTAALGS